MGSGISQGLGIVDRMRRPITMMLLILSMLSFLHPILQLIYSTIIHISISHCCNCFLLIAHHLFESYLEVPARILLLLPLPVPSGTPDLSKTTISITISSSYFTIAMIIEMSIRHPRTSLLGDHSGMQWASGHEKNPSHEHFGKRVCTTQLSAIMAQSLHPEHQEVYIDAVTRDEHNPAPLASRKVSDYAYQSLNPPNVVYIL